ncbi:MAG: glycosyltransferase family 2 protein [Timaviella obliquedivisa GSE-PSE-MK23-08B]|jgi:glycosyltransferase involved in cell wall biosynthesis|nr:glycosyltransferase family 2 protein [Timaviella obliquedivisa GSE-PSE-MK23-08B]
MTSTPFVSVIIPVFNDIDRLQRCLAALEQQTYSKLWYEVIVIDNGSTEGNVAEVATAFEQVITTFESQTGSYAARNRGLALAKGEVIAFTDADCIPATNWLENGVTVLLNTSNCGLVAGKIDIFFKNPAKLTLVERYENIMAFQQREHLEQYQYGSTANVFTFRQVIDRVGQFDATLKSNGDFEWGRRVAAHGYQQVYAENACVAHPARHSFAELYKRSIRLAGGIYDAQIQRCGTALQRNKLFVRSVLEDFLSPVLEIPNVLSNSNLRTLEQKAEIYFISLWVKYIRGFEKIRLKLGGVSSRG